MSFDETLPGKPVPIGHLHPVTQAISEITDIFEKVGFVRVRYPEVDWDWYPFESLNMPKTHPARDEWETFFIDSKEHKVLGKMVLTPHTSNGQVREMERLKTPPIRMINIAKCYRRQSDVSHTPMFHQFEGLVVDKGISVVHLKGTIDYFVKQFFGPKRRSRLRPYHFQFTEPSFEVDVTCDICLGKAVLPSGQPCRLCKEGWLELGGAGMVHPNVLRNGRIDPSEYTGFAFGWGVERTYMMKSGIKIDDLRLLYNNDIRFLNQF
jgi:phenylalanyl-tRNA synthetase alpha chain